MSKRLAALILKEFLQMRRDISSFLIGIVLPLILLFLYGFGVSLDMNHLRIGLVLEETSPVATSFAQALTASPFFDVTVGRHREEMVPLLIEGKIRGIVVVPSYFSEFLLRDSTVAPIQVIADGSEPNTASFVQNYVQGAFVNWVGVPPRVEVENRMWYNEELVSRNFLIPGSIAIIMTLIGTLLTALVVAREWERGTMEALISTPVGVLELLLGKLIPYFILGFLSMTLCVAIATLLYGVPLRGSFFSLSLVSAAFLFTAIQVGLLISTLSKNQFVASQISIIVGFLPAFILSGFIFEISSMPVPIQFITNLVPARYFVVSLQTIFLVGDVWEVILPNALAILGFGLGVLLITALKFKKRLDA